jgi:protein TonB
MAVLRIAIETNGSVGNIEVVESSGYELLDEAAVAAVKRWKFVPEKIDGQPVATRVEQAINFKINRG